jgi:hypothetical protein
MPSHSYVVYFTQKLVLVHNVIRVDCVGVDMRRERIKNSERENVHFQIAVIFQFMSEQFSYCHPISWHFSPPIFFLSKHKGPKNSATFKWVGKLQSNFLFHRYQFFLFVSINRKWKMMAMLSAGYNYR